jgi:hypothetical protein
MADPTNASGDGARNETTLMSNEGIYLAALKKLLPVEEVAFTEEEIVEMKANPSRSETFLKRMSASERPVSAG